jgi:shikimate kinase
LITQRIALIGMPGCGKSTVGRHASRQINFDFVDTDLEVERLAGSTVREYFATHGESAFRDLESRALDSATTREGCVVATGGGIVLRESNRTMLTQRCTVVYLRSSPEDLARRLRHDTKRPLLQGADQASKLRELHAQRDALYRETAHFIIETGRPSVPMLVNMMLMQLELAGVVMRSPRA